MALLQTPPMAARVRAAFSRRAPHYDAGASLQRAVAWRLARHCRDLPIPRGPRADLGAGTGLLSRALERQRPGLRLLRLDACADLMAQGRALPDSEAAAVRGTPGGQLVWDLNAGLPGPLDGASLLVSSFALHWLDDPHRSLRRWCTALGPGGWLALAVPTAGSFPQWRRAAVAAGVPWTGLELPAASQLVAGAAAGLELRLAQCLRFSWRGPSGRGLLRRIQAVGAGATPAAPLSVGQWRRLEDHWGPSSGGGKGLTWEVLLLLGRRPSAGERS